MNILQSNIIPKEGIGELKLLMSYDSVKKYLKDNKIRYNEEYWPHKGYDSDVPWKIIRIAKCISMFFAYDKLWKFYLEEGFEGKLPNGIYIGMDIDEAKKLDKTATLDDWDEEYISAEGYRFEDSLETGKVVSITIAIPEVIFGDDDGTEFYSYEWAK